MRDDYRNAAATLQMLGRCLAECPDKHRHRRAAYVMRLARLLQENPLIRSTVVEFEGRERVDEDALQARRRELSDKTARGLSDLWESLEPCSDATKRTIKELTATRVRETKPEKVGDIWKALRLGQEVEFSLPEIVELQAAFSTKLRGSLEPLASADDEIPDVLSVLDTFDTLRWQAADLLEVEEFLRRTSIGRIATHLRASLFAWEGRLAGTYPSASMMSDEVAQDLGYLIESISARLDEGIVRLYALHRLRVLFEHFDKDVLRETLGQAEAQHEPREAILQAAMDRFLFHDGFYPLTHSAASGGYLDTLVLEKAEGSGLPPLLVELKQVTAFAKPSEASRAAVRRVLGEAKGEVERYRGHVATRPAWAGTSPVIVVVHTCDEDLSDLEGPDVVLIDLSGVVPSSKKRAKVQ